MCGFLALIATPWRDSLGAALDTLAARGPDDAGLLDLGEALFGHRRLSVIDLAGGHQPMASADGRLAIVFNGEIYNFRELRRELEGRGHAFRSLSDTEVLLHGFREWGRDLLPKLDGMFAFAVWDREARRLFAARDRLGVKPLFYSTASGLTLASTLAPFFALAGFPRRLDYEALRDYLAFQTPLSPHTFLGDVLSLPPGGWLAFEAPTGRFESGRYWEIPAPADNVPDQETLLAETDAALRESVRRQLVADVPLGAFLSGGIDSGLVVHYMAEAGSQPLKTFSVRFAEAEFDESPHARAVAERFGTEHHVIEAPAITPERLLTAIRALDQPLADPAYVPTFELSRLTRAHVTVALSGDGGDELFGGYPRFRDQEADHPDAGWRRVLRRLIRLGLAPGALLRRCLAGQELLWYRHVELGPWLESRKSLKRYLDPQALAACHPERTLGLWRDLALSFGGRMDTGSLMRADLWTYLSENCLVKTDRASMAHGLEVRVPLLGNASVDLALRLPASAHFDPEGKALLRALARRHLPEAVWNRPKHGFSVPLGAYFRGQWRDLCESYLGQCEALAPFLDAGAVRALWQQARDGHGSKRLAYTFIVLLAWLETYGLRAQ